MSERSHPDTARLGLIRVRFDLVAEARRILSDTRAAFRLALERTRSDLDALERAEPDDNPGARLDEIRALARVLDERLEAKRAALDARRSQVERGETALGQAIHGEQIDLFPAEAAPEVNAIPALTYLPDGDRIVEANTLQAALEPTGATESPPRLKGKRRAPPRPGVRRTPHADA